MKLPRNLLDRPAEAMCRLIAPGFLDRVAAARRHLKPEEPEVLHDFRVGIRRVWTALRAIRHELRGGVTLRSRRLPFEDSPVEPPEWLKPYVVRGITGEDEFSNPPLAR